MTLAAATPTASAPAKARIGFTWRPSAAVLLVAPLVLFMLVFYAVPVADMLLRSVAEPRWSLQHYAGLADDAVFGLVFWNTVKVALIVTAGSALLGYPVALALSRMRPLTAKLVLLIVLLPFWTSVLVRSYAWMVLLGRKGLVNEALIASGMIETPLKILNTPLAVYIAMIHILLPYMILPIANTLRQIDPALGRAAAGLGATPFGVFRQVTLPLSMPGVAAGVLLVFVLSIGFYITPTLVGGPRDMMLATLIAQQVEHLNWPYAAALATILLATSLAIVAVFNRLPGVRQSFGTMAR